MHTQMLRLSLLMVTDSIPIVYLIYKACSYGKDLIPVVCEYLR